MPDIDEAIYKQYADDDVLVFGIYSNEDPELLDGFVEQTGVSFPIVEDQYTLYRFSFPQGVGYPYPRDVVIGPDLTVHSIKNSFDADEMDALVRELLGK